MALTLEQATGQQFLLSFEGKDRLPQEFLEVLRRQQVGGVVLFRHQNMGSLVEVRSLTRALQKAARQTGQPELLIAADQEGGQLMALGHGTPFPGNMALGATGSESLAYKVGRALAVELAAAGINIDFAPVCDVNINPANPVIGTRSFGSDPKLVARLASAMIRGLQSAGVAATAKHFPGHGDTSTDSHHRAPLVNHDRRRIHAVELAPFRAAVKSRARLMMPAHIVMPALNGRVRDLPATLSPHILRELLRSRMGFQGIVVSDALDMHAMEQGPGYIAEVIAAVSSGIDLLLFNHDLSRVEGAWRNLIQAARRGLLSADEIQLSAKRIVALKSWISRWPQPPLNVVRSRKHLQLAQEVARRSVTLVRDKQGLLPLRIRADERIAVAMPRPEDLTPADTSSYEQPELATSLRRYHPHVDGFSFDINPQSDEIEHLCDQLSHYELVLVGTINANANPGQRVLVERLRKRGCKMIAVALRLPYDITCYPAVRSYACTYSILQPSMEALADALFGRVPFQGTLPVTIPGIRET
jgi:beta-N-acetylhexosaminidase